MFRLDAKPSKCPIGGAASAAGANAGKGNGINVYQFSYQKGHGTCNYPMSSMNQCADKSKIVLRYQACADVIGSETR